MYNYSKEIETGNTAIDSQHIKWIDNLNQVLKDCAEGKGRDHMRQNLIFLKDYTTKHFADEEQLQIKYQYPGYAQHKQFHENFKKTVDNIIDDFNKNGPSIVLTGRINMELGSWFINHIKREDFRLVEHIKKSTG